MPSGRTIISPKSVRGLGHVTPTIFGSTVGYPSDSLASCRLCYRRQADVLIRVHGFGLSWVWSSGQCLCVGFGSVCNLVGLVIGLVSVHENGFTFLFPRQAQQNTPTVCCMNSLLSLPHNLFKKTYLQS